MRLLFVSRRNEEGELPVLAKNDSYLAAARLVIVSAVSISGCITMLRVATE